MTVEDGTVLRRAVIISAGLRLPRLGLKSRRLSGTRCSPGAPRATASSSRGRRRRGGGGDSAMREPSSSPSSRAGRADPPPGRVPCLGHRLSGASTTRGGVLWNAG
ncbi:hypothetical protein QJS66_14300 [Kocuria rhizophila]|nr:hypothetical protein QJS66_14300 [Kocuria rhizophila]